MTTIHIFPHPDRIVLDPHSKEVLPPEGIDVDQDNRYWQRRLRDQDVSEQDPSEPQQDEPAPDSEALVEDTEQDVRI